MASTAAARALEERRHLASAAEAASEAARPAGPARSGWTALALAR